MRILSVGAGLAFLIGVVSAAPANDTTRALSPFAAVQRTLGAPNGFQRADFDLLINYRGPEPKCLPWIQALLHSPDGVDSIVPALRSGLRDTASNGMMSAGAAWSALEAPADALPLASLSEGLNQVERHEKAFLAPLSPSDRRFLQREAPALFLHHEEDTSLNAIQSESERLREDSLSDAVMRLASECPRTELARASQALDGILLSILGTVRAQGWRRAAQDLRALRKRGISVDIGSAGDDTHRVRNGIVFDPAGNDRYEFPDSTAPGTWLLVIDLAGDDEYHAADTAGGAGAFLSLQIVADMAGDDRYLAKDFAFGSAVMGYGRLYDAAGNDVYEARCASLGFAFEGVGILEDRAGNDLYSAYYLSEGAATPNGFGVLRDHAGNDHYVARPVFVDDLRYQNHFLSLSQGFATGFSPRYAGGIGVLWDQTGEDTYAADIFAQGSGYWFSLGLLLDDAGNDHFLAHQYAQGAGVHFATGILWDAGGDDTRISKGVSQGCGHDGGFGLLVDAQGNDHTFAVDMSLGAGSANGLGMYADFAGDDVYEAQNSAMTLGHGDLRRDRGSLGFFLDAGGRDRYPPRFQEGTAWRVYDGKHRGYGFGFDAP